MAAAKRNAMGIAELRDRIQTLRLVNRLEDHVLKGEKMEKSQVSAAVALLRKTLPDLAVHTLEGNPDNPITLIERVIVKADAKNG